MVTLALTGGIATGKSTFASLFLELAPGTAFFDCDACVHELLTTEEVARKVDALLGPGLADYTGRLDRGRLRERVFDRPHDRRTLENLLHPLVRARCQLAGDKARAASVEYFLIDVPLLYESGFPIARDREIVVACGPEEQRRRLLARRGITPELAERILAAQWPLPEKIARAGTVIWNGGSRDALRRQTEQFLLWLKNKTRK